MEKRFRRAEIEILRFQYENPDKNQLEQISAAGHGYNYNTTVSTIISLHRQGLVHGNKTFSEMYESEQGKMKRGSKKSRITEKGIRVLKTYESFVKAPYRFTPFQTRKSLDSIKPELREVILRGRKSISKRRTKKQEVLRFGEQYQTQLHDLEKSLLGNVGAIEQIKDQHKNSSYELELFEEDKIGMASIVHSRLSEMLKTEPNFSNEKIILGKWYSPLVFLSRGYESGREISVLKGSVHRYHAADKLSHGHVSFVTDPQDLIKQFLDRGTNGIVIQPPLQIFHLSNNDFNVQIIPAEDSEPTYLVVKRDSLDTEGFNRLYYSIGDFDKKIQNPTWIFNHAQEYVENHLQKDFENIMTTNDLFSSLRIINN